MYTTYSFILFFFINEVNKLLKVGKSLVCYQLVVISKIAITFNLFGTSHIFTISHILTHFCCGHTVRK